ncbi:phosphoribosylanthranilate isomerase [Neorhodopirellula lusitana]|uniref:phosphoribosylanthranilate isomerase n=1 Tax=Neorhodopirellula lusitana TaxID=445327 RepID=UPI00384F2960
MSNPTTKAALFRLKVCGIRTMEDVQACADAGVDCVGLNFYRPSVRYLDPLAEEIQAINSLATQCGLYRVGLFVNESIETVQQIAKQLQLDAVQFHGDETVEYVQQFLRVGIPVIRAIRLPTVPLEAGVIHSHVERWLDPSVTMLIDADAGAQFGGGGKQLHWPSIAAWARQYAEPLNLPWILAGGLTPQCVSEAKRVSTAGRVDVASGVENPRGTKSAALIREFVQACGPGGVDETA